MGHRLREALADRGMSMAALSERAKLPYTSVQNYAADKQLPGAEALLKIKHSLAISVDWLLTGEGEAAESQAGGVPRPLTMRDYQLLRARFSDFDEVFSLKNVWKIYENEGILEEVNLLVCRNTARYFRDKRPESAKRILDGRAIEDLSFDECVEFLYAVMDTISQES